MFLSAIQRSFLDSTEKPAPNFTSLKNICVIPVIGALQFWHSTACFFTAGTVPLKYLLNKHKVTRKERKLGQHQAANSPMCFPRLPVRLMSPQITQPSLCVFLFFFRESNLLLVKKVIDKARSNSSGHVRIFSAGIVQ